MKCDLEETELNALYSKLNDFIKFLSKQSYSHDKSYVAASVDYVQAYSYIINKMNQGNQEVDTVVDKTSSGETNIVNNEGSNVVNSEGGDGGISHSNQAEEKNVEVPIMI